jgi:RNA-directed DNA polymerase
MEAVVEKENMRRAYHRVVSNKGSAGIDEMGVYELGAHLKEHWAEIKRQLLEGTYKPQAVRGVEIPKPGKKGTRRLGIPTVVDRLIQQAVLQAQEYARQGYQWVVDLDLEKFFDRVNHDMLMARVARKVTDKRVLRTIRRFLQAGVMEQGLVSPRREGTPQGGPLSPLLSNIMLDDLDKELERRGHRFCRYADDANIYVRTERAGQRVKESVTALIRQKLKLKVNEEKSAVDRIWNRSFLGYTVLPGKLSSLRVAPESVKRLSGKLQQIFRMARGWSLSRLIERLTPILRGWGNYYRLTEVEAAFKNLDKWIRRRLRCILWREAKRSLARARMLMKRGLPEEQAWRSATNGRGPWWNAGAAHMHFAFPKRFFDHLGLFSLLDMLRLHSTRSRTAVYGTVRTVV